MRLHKTKKDYFENLILLLFISFCKYFNHIIKISIFPRNMFAYNFNRIEFYCYHNYIACLKQIIINAENRRQVENNENHNYVFAFIIDTLILKILQLGICMNTGNIPHLIFAW